MKVVGIAAYGGHPSECLAREAREFVKHIAKLASSIALAVGGCWGLMEVVVREALNQGLTVIVLAPSERSSYCREYAGYRNLLLFDTGVNDNARSVLLVRVSQVLVALGGGAGTFMEALMAYREAKPVVALTGCGADTDMYFLEAYKRWGCLDSRCIERLYVVKNGSEAARKTLELLG